MLHLHAGEFKTLPFLNSLSNLIDFTAFTLVVSVLVGIYTIFNKRSHSFPHERISFFGLFLVFFAFVFISWYSAPSSEDSMRKMIEFSTIIFWCFFSGSFIINTPTRIKRFLILSVLIGLITSFATMYQLTMQTSTYIGTIGGFSGGYQRAGILAGANICIIIMAWSRGKYDLKTKILFLFVLVVSLIGLIVSTHRSTWIAIVLALTFTSLFVKGISLRNRTYIVLTLLFLFTVTFFSFGNTERGQYLLRRFSHESASFDPSSNPRLATYVYSLGQITKNPKNFTFGIGFGNFKNYSSSPYRHSHNIFLEFLLELGFFGLIFLLLFLTSWKMIRLSSTNSNNNLLVIYTMLFWYFLIHTNFGGDIPNNRVFWVYLILLFNLRLSISKMNSSSILKKYQD